MSGFPWWIWAVGGAAYAIVYFFAKRRAAKSAVTSQAMRERYEKQEAERALSEAALVQEAREQEARKLVLWERAVCALESITEKDGR